MVGRTTARTSMRSRLAAALGSALMLFSILGTAAPAVLADPSSPVSVVKTASKDPVASGEQLTYTITITNLGSAKVNNVVMTDQVQGVGVIQNPPALPQLTITSSKGSCTQGGPNGNLVTCDAGTLSGNQVWTVTIRGQVTAANGATLNNTASVTGTKSAQTFTTTGSVSVLVSGGTGGGEQLPDLTINKTGPTSVGLSESMTYTLTINNVGTANTSDVRVVDTLPPGVTLAGTPFETTSLFDCSSAGNPITVTCDGGAVNQGQNATIKINAISPASATPNQITNTAVVDPDNDIEESNELNNTSATVNTSLSGPPPAPLLSIKKTDGEPNLPGAWNDGAGPDPVNPGEQLVYKIQVVNNATSRADDVRVSDTTQFLEASSITASQVIVDGAIGTGGGCVVNAPEVVCSIRSLNAGGTMTITIRGVVIGPAGSNIFNTATVHGNIKNVGVTNTSTESTTIRPSIDLSIVKTDSPDPACARTWPTTNPDQHLANPPDGLGAASGDIPGVGLLAPPVCLGGLTYRFVVGNSGNGDAIDNVTVRDPLPAGLIFDSYATNGGFHCSVNGSNVVLCTGGSIPAAGTRWIEFRLVAPPNVGTITNTVTVDPNNAIFEPDETNNTDTETTTISTGIDLVIWKGDDTFDTVDTDPNDEDPPGGAPALTEGFDPIATNGTQTYTIIVDNVGTQDVTGIKVRDVLPAGTRFLSFSATNGFTCTHDGSTLGGVVTCIGGHLLGTASEFYQKPGTPPPPAPGDDRATIVIKVFATPFVQPILHNEVRVDPDNEIVEVNELNNFAFQNTTVGVGDAGQGAFNQLTIDKTQIDPAVAPPAPPHPPLPGFVADANATVAQNGIVVYDLLVTNSGTDPVSAIVVKDFLPTGSRFIEASDTDVGPSLSDAFFCFHDGAPTGGTITCVGGDLSGTINVIPDGAGQVPTFRIIRVKIFAPNTPGTYPNIVVVDPDNVVAEGNEFDNDDAVFTTVTVGGNNMFIDLAITKCDQDQLPADGADDDPGCAFDSDPVAPSGQIHYVLTVSNLGTDPAFGVKVTDNLPVGTTFVSAEDSAPGVGAFDCVHAAGVITCTGGTIDGSSDLVPGVGTSRTIDILLMAPNAKGPITNQAFVDPGNAILEGNETNNSDTETTNIVPRINLKLDKNGPDTAHQNDVDEYVITVTNEAPTGDGLTANDVVVVDALPIGLIPLYIEAPSNFICEFTENPVNGVRCVGDMSAEGADPDTHVAEIKIGVFVTAEEGPLDNEACVDPTDPAHPEGFIIESTEADNCKTKTTTVLKLSPDLNVNKTADTATATPGQTITYTVTVSNTGDATALGPITLTDDLTPGANPLKVDYVSATATNGYTCSFTSPDLVECTGGSLAPGDATVATIKVKVKTGATGSVLNEASVPDDTAFDPAAAECAGSACANEAAANTSSTNANNKATESVALTGTGIDLVMLSLEDDPDATAPGGIVTYTAQVSNTGTADAEDAVVQLTLPTTGLNHVISSASNGFTCEFLFPNITCEGDLPAGGTTEVTLVTHVTASAPPDTSVTVTAAVDPSNAIAEDDETNNEKSQTTTVSASCATDCVDLVASPVIGSPDPVNAGDIVTFIVGVGNAGSDATSGDFDIALKLDGAAFTFDGGFQTAQPSDDYSASAGFDCSYLLGDTVTCTGDLDGGEGVLIILKVRVTDPPTDNAISLQVTADSGTSETEADELNNEATGSVSVVDTP